MNFKPMLSASLDGVELSTLRYPLLLSPKLDGVRCIVWEGIAYSRNAKPIRNRFVQKWAEDLHNLDGELIVGSPTGEHCLNATQSGVMSYEGEPDFTFHLFDCPVRFDSQDRFDVSLEHVQKQHMGEHRIECVPHYPVNDETELELMEHKLVTEGYEGIMLRDPIGPYKNGRSTLREGYLMKLKRFTDGEGVVVGIEEGQINENDLERDELGRAKRSSDSSGMRPSGMVGTFLVQTEEWGVIRVAPGTMSHQMRRVEWERKDSIGFSLIGKTIHWRSFGYGTKDKPRFPRFYGVREDV